MYRLVLLLGWLGHSWDCQRCYIVHALLRNYPLWQRLQYGFQLGRGNLSIYGGIPRQEGDLYPNPSPNFLSWFPSCHVSYMNTHSRLTLIHRSRDIWQIIKDYCCFRNHCLKFRYTKTAMGGKHKGIAHSCVMKVPASEFAEYCQILSTCPSCFLVGLVIINHLCWVSSSAVTCCCCTLPFLHHVVQSSHFSC